MNDCPNCFGEGYISDCDGNSVITIKCGACNGTGYKNEVQK